MQTLNEKNIALRKETLARRHRETECGPVKVGDVVLARNIGTYFGYIDCVLICTAVVENCARFSGYTDDTHAFVVQSIGFEYQAIVMPMHLGR